MPTIEQRVVEMRFDNKQFEDNADQSIKTLDKLNESLDFKNGSKGLEKLQEAAGKFKLTGMEVALNSITEKFSALEIAGITAIQNLANKVTNWGTNMFTQFTTAPIATGWEKYATKTEAVQTIMSAIAKDIPNEEKRMAKVNEQMEKLSWFTDETSYSLTDMTSNIGKFTSNGIKLEDAVTQMEGISVWASLSGASINDASRAMYNLSQAMASGTVKSIDWMSIENANMATKEFKEQAIEAAVSLGTLKKTTNGYTTAAGKAVDVTKDFKGTLSEGWFTNKVLAKTLNKFGGFTDALKDFQDEFDIGSATEALQWIDKYSKNASFADEQAKKLGVDSAELKKHLDKLTSSEMELGRKSFMAAQEAKTFKEAIEATKEAVSSGWMQTFEYIFGDYLEAKKLWTNLSTELYNVFAASAYDRNQILALWHSGMENIADGAKGYDLLMASFSNIWDGIKNIGSIIGDAWESVFPSYEKYEEAAAPLIELTAKFKDITEKIKGYFGELKRPIDEVVQEIKDNPVTEMVETVSKSMSTVERTQEKLQELAKRTRKLEFGNGEDRIKKIREMGYSYEVVQNEVNRQIEEEAKARGENLQLIRHAIREEDKKKKKVKEVTAVEKDLTEALKEQGIIQNDDGSYTYVLTEAERRTEILHSAFVNLFSAVEVGKKLIEGLFKLGGAVIAHVAKLLEGPFWNAMEAITDSFEYFFEVFEPAYKVEEFFENLIPIVTGAIDIIAEFFGKLGQNAGIVRLGNSLRALGDMFSEIIGKIFEKLKERKDAIDWAKTLETILGYIGDTLGWFADKIAGVVDYITSHKDDIKNFLKSINDAIPKNLDGFGESMENLKENLKNFGGGFFERIAYAVGGVIKIISNQFGNPNSTLNTTIGVASKMFGKLWEMLKGFDLNKLGTLAKGGGIAAVAYMIFNFVKTITDGLKNIGKIPTKLVEILDGVSGVLEGYQKKLNSEALLNVAKAVGIFVLSLIGLTLISPDDLTRVTATMLIIGGLVAAIMAIIGKMKSSKEDTSIAETIMEPIQGFIDKAKETMEKMGKMIGMGVLIAAVAIAVGMLIHIINSLMDVPWGKFLSACGMLIISIGLLVGSAVLLSKYAENFDFSMGMGLLAFAAALLILTKAIEPLAAMDFLGLLKGVGALGLLMLGMAEAAKIAGDADISTFGTAMMALASAMNLLIIPIKSFAAMDFPSLLVGVGAVGLIVAAMAALAIQLSKNEGATDEMAKLVKALTDLTKPMLLIGAAAKIAALGLGIIAATMAVLLISAFLADKVAIGLQTLSTAMIEVGVGAMMFGVAAALIGVGAAGIAAAIYLVVKAFPALIDGLIYLGQAVMEHGQELFVGFVTLLGLIAAAVIAASPGLAGSIVTLITTVGGAIVGSLPILSGQAFALIMGLLVFLYSIAGPVVNSLLDIIVAAIHALADGLRNHAAPIFSAIGDILDACFDLIIEFIASVADMIPGVGGMVGNWIRGAKDWVQPTEEIAEELQNSAVQSVQGTGSVMQDQMNEESGNIDISESTTELGDHIGGTFGEATESGFGKWLESSGMTGLIDQYKDNFTEGVIAADEEAGDEGIKAFIESLGIGMDAFDIDAFFGEKMDEGTEGAVEAAGVGGEHTAGSFIDKMAEEFDISSDTVSGMFSGVVDDASDSADTTAQSRGPSTGGYYVSGIDKGIRAGERTLYNSGWFAADTVDKGYKARSKTESPSKVAIQNGKFWDMGLALGIIRNSDIVETAGKKSAQTVMDTMRNIVGTISDAINGDMDMNPTITPVLDLSNIQNGTNAINGMFGNTKTYAMASINGAQFEANRLSALTQIEANSTNADVVAALGLLRGDVNNLNDSFLNTQVVLDSGALVGATARQMDNALGRINVYKGRGI